MTADSLFIFKKNHDIKGFERHEITYTYICRGTTHFGFSDFSHAIAGYVRQPLDIEVSHKLVIDLSIMFLKRFLHKGGCMTVK